MRCPCKTGRAIGNDGIQEAVTEKPWRKDTQSRSVQRAAENAGRGRVTRESDSLTLEKGVFTKTSPRAIALSLKRSADRSRRRKSNAYRSAMSMLTFFINRAGRGLPRARKQRLQKAKNELRELYGKT